MKVSRDTIRSKILPPPHSTIYAPEKVNVIIALELLWEGVQGRYNNFPTTNTFKNSIKIILFQTKEKLINRCRCWPSHL